MGAQVRVGEVYRQLLKLPPPGADLREANLLEAEAKSVSGRLADNQHVLACGTYLVANFRSKGKGDVGQVCREAACVGKRGWDAGACCDQATGGTGRHGLLGSWGVKEGWSHLHCRTERGCVCLF